MQDENKNIIQEEESNIDWFGMVVKAIRGYKFILIVTFIFTIIGIAFNINRKRYYTVSVELAPEVKARTNSTVSSLARLMGASSSSLSGDENDALNITLFPDICSSTPFLLKMLDVPVNTLKNDFLGKPKVSLFTYVTTPRDSTSIFAKVVGGIISSLRGKDEEDEIMMSDRVKKYFDNTPLKLDKEHRYAVKYLSAAIKADIDKKTAITTISVRMDDPLIAATVADTVCARLQEYIIEYRTRKVKNDLKYYQKLEAEAREKYIRAQQAYAACVDYDQSAILQSVKSEKERLQNESLMASQIYAQVRQQVETTRAKIQEAKPVFAVVQPATIPTRPSGHGRKYYVFLYFIFGFAISTFWVVYGREAYHNAKASIKEKMNDKENKEESSETEE